MLEYNGKSQPVSAWAEQYGIPYFLLLHRVRLGWAIEDALTIPVIKRIDETVGKQIKTMLADGMTQRQIAEKTGFTPSAVCKFLKRKK